MASGISESTILGIEVGGAKKRAFVKARQRDSLTNKIIHIDFLEVVSGRLIHARVPLHLVGIPVGVREGGILENPAHEIEVQCDPDYLPQKIDVDVSELHANHSIHVRELPALDKVKVLSSPELVVAVVKFAKEEVVEAPVAAAAPVEGAVPGAPEFPAPRPPQEPLPLPEPLPPQVQLPQPPPLTRRRKKRSDLWPVDSHAGSYLAALLRLFRNEKLPGMNPAYNPFPTERTIPRSSAAGFVHSEEGLIPRSSLRKTLQGTGV